MKCISKNFFERMLWGSLAALFALIAITLSHVPALSFLFLITLIGISSLALWEYFQLASAKMAKPSVWIGIGLSALYLTLRFFFLFSPHAKLISEIFIFSFMTTLFLGYFRKAEGSITSMATTLFGFVYITIPIGLMIDVNFGCSKTAIEHTPIWLYYLLIITKACDTGAYFVGKQWGKIRITPTLSPQKTLEGAFGGCLLSLIVSLGFYTCITWFNIKVIPVLTFGEFLALGLLMPIASIIGDLAESLIKRDAKTKDSNGLPGFGGVLDMLDSLLFTTPLLYLYLKLQLL